MRPLTVRRECSSLPLFGSGLPVSGWSGGGKSRFRGLEAELDSRLIGELSKVGKEVADFLLTGVDDLAGWGRVDGSGHILAKLLEVLAQLGQQILRRESRFGSHGRVLSGQGHSRGSVFLGRTIPQLICSRKICHTRRSPIGGRVPQVYAQN